MMENYSQVLHYYPTHTENLQTLGFYSTTTNFPSSIDMDQYDISGPYCTRSEDEDDIKRPMNSFLLWAKIMRRRYAHENPNLHNAEISKLLGKIWNSMSVKDKRPFVEKAEKLRVIHMRTYPNYRYAPKKRKEKRSTRTISPEIAAALQSTICDVKSIISSQLSKKNSINDLKSYGYLRKACENNAMSNDDKDHGISPMGNKINFEENGTNNLCQKNNSSAISDNPEEGKPVERMTLHYYPRVTKLKAETKNVEWSADSAQKWSAEVLKTEDVSRVFEEHNLAGHDLSNKTKRTAKWCALADQINSNTKSLQHESKISQLYDNTLPKHLPRDHVTRENKLKLTDGNNCIELYMSDDSAIYSNDELGSLSLDREEDIDDELPDVLKKLFNRPLHYANNEINDDTSLWSDIGEIISAGKLQ